ncbi:MAG: SDR family oxidoreductase [Gammaproteobacteria bacterium]|jgi:short-subunit dehydrogenase|nr:SDR family oxidoreductase [Gammaproteobacteria bacterium]
MNSSSMSSNQTAVKPARTPAKTALITGASAGIGAEFARQLAARGYDLVLTARRLDRLQQLADDLHAKHGIKTSCIAADLADPGAVGQLMASMAAKQLQIDTLINNAGYGVPGELTSVDWDSHRKFMQVLVMAVIELCYQLLPGMQQRGHGRIVNVASLAGLVPGTASHTLYSASKAFLIKLSESLALENEAAGIKVQALCPGFTYSEFHDVTGSRELVSQMPAYMWMQAEDVVRISLQALEQDHAPVLVVPGRVNRMLARIAAWLPHRRALNLVRKRSRKYRQQD